MQTEEISEKEQTIIMAFCIMSALLNLLVLILVLINACRHLIKKKMSKRIIILFYLFSLFNIITNFVILAIHMMKPETAVTELDLHVDKEIPIPVIISASTNLGLFLVNGLSMYVFTITFQMVRGKLEYEQVRARKNVSFGIAALILVAFITSLVFYIERMNFYYISTGFATLVMIVQIVILIVLRIKTSRLGCFKLLQSTINSIYAQFGVFVAVYFIIILFNGVRLLTKDNTDSDFKFGLAVLNIIIKQFLFQIPIIYIIFVH